MPKEPQEPEVKAVVRLLLVDDHEMVRLGLKTLLSKSPDISVVGEATSVASAVEATWRLTPDVVLLDLRLPDGSGLDACRRILDGPGKSRVLILTSFVTDQLVMDAIAAGADGYLLKEVDGTGLVRAIQQVAAGQNVFAPIVAERIREQLRRGKEPAVERKLESLSPQEMGIIVQVAEGKTNKEIAQEMGLSDKTVKNYMANLMEKLGISRRSHAAAYYAEHSKKASSNSND